MFDAGTEVPKWATYSDREIDISDNWIDHMDPENECGCHVIACMNGDIDGQLTIDGIIVDDGVCKQYYSREKAMTLLGYETIVYIEQWEMEAAAPWGDAHAHQERGQLAVGAFS